MDEKNEQMMRSCQDSSEGKEIEYESYCPGKLDMSPEISQKDCEEKKISEYAEACRERSAVAEGGARCLEECLKICRDLGVSLEDVKDFLREVKFMVDE